MKITSWGKTYDVKLNVTKYGYWDNLCVRIEYYDDEFDGYMPYANLTVNICNLPDGYACLDTNNLSCAEEFVTEYGIAVPTGEYKVSGFCTYPVYKFDMKKMEEYV